MARPWEETQTATGAIEQVEGRLQWLETVEERHYTAAERQRIINNAKRLYMALNKALERLGI